MREPKAAWLWWGGNIKKKISHDPGGPNFFFLFFPLTLYIHKKNLWQNKKKLNE